MHHDFSLALAKEKGFAPGGALSSYPAACNRAKKDPDR